MKYKKLLSAFLATAMTVATVLPGAGTIQACLLYTSPSPRD